MQSNPREKLTQVVLSVFRVNSLLLEKGDEMVAPLGMTSARWQVLGAIALAGHPLSCPQVAAAMGVTRQGALKQLNLAQEAKLVVPVSNPRHERSPLYGLSERGTDVYERAMRLQARWASALLKGIAEKDLKAAQDVLSALEHRLSATPLPKKE